jgi:DNA-binding NtrC family response regulator
VGSTGERTGAAARSGDPAAAQGDPGAGPPASERLELLISIAAQIAICPLPAAGSVTIGRSEENDVRVDDASVSRRHARLHIGPPLRIEDLGSSNGVRVREASADGRTAQLRRIESGSSSAVKIGDGLSLGAALLVVRRAEAPARAAGGFLVCDETTRKLHDLAAKVARGDISVLLLGETGAGKEVLAEVIHRASPRRGGPFLRLSCAALSESLLESELFGHEKGAFTGALQGKPGLLETADGGTVFLDEIGELSAPTQVKLLRVLEERKVTRVGGLVARPIDVRLIAATNRDLEAEARKGTFRQDLFFRLNGISLTVPPLRERRDEIAPLARMFAARAAERMGRPAPEISAAAIEALGRHAWPGNVRELRNVMERAVVLLDAGAIGPEHLLLSAAITPGAAAAGQGLRSELAASERQRIVDALEACAGNQTQAAAMLGMSRRTLVVRLSEYAIPRPRKR